MEKKYLELREQSMDPEIISDQKRSIQINKEISSLQDLYDLIQSYKKYEEQVKSANEMLVSENDPDMLDMAKEELKDGETHLEDLDKKIKIALLPQDPNDDKDVFLEIRPAAGGDEA
ncbi:MAG: PCRF domain-containing protein [bacterium]